MHVFFGVGSYVRVRVCAHASSCVHDSTHNSMCGTVFSSFSVDGFSRRSSTYSLRHIKADAMSNVEFLNRQRPLLSPANHDTPVFVSL